MVARGRKGNGLRLDVLCTVRKSKKRSNDEVRGANGQDQMMVTDRLRAHLESLLAPSGPAPRGKRSVLLLNRLCVCENSSLVLANPLSIPPTLPDHPRPLLLLPLIYPLMLTARLTQPV